MGITYTTISHYYHCCSDIGRRGDIAHCWGSEGWNGVRNGGSRSEEGARYC